MPSNLLIVKNGDVYSAKKQQIIAEIVSGNIWKNKLLQHYEGINGIGTGYPVADSNVQNTYINLKPSYALSPINEHNKKVIAFMKDFLGMDVNDIARKIYVGEVAIAHFGLRADTSYGGLEYVDYTSKKSDVSNVVDNAISSLSTSLSTVNKIVIEMFSQFEYKTPYYTVQQDAINDFYANNYKPALSNLKGYSTPFNSWLQNVDGGYTNDGISIANRLVAGGYRIRLYNGTTEVYAQDSSVSEMLSVVLRLTNAIEGIATSNTSADSTSAPTIVTSRTGGRNGTTKYSAYGRAKTTITLSTTGNFSSISSYAQVIKDSIDVNWNVLNPHVTYKGKRRRGGGALSGITQRYLASDYQARVFLKILAIGVLQKSLWNWLALYGAGYYRQWHIKRNEYKNTSYKEIMFVIGIMLNIWIEEDGGGFWNSTFGKIVGFFIFATVLIAGIVSMVASAGASSPFVATAYGAVGALLFTGATLFAGYVMKNAHLVKMVRVVSIATGVIMIGASIANQIGQVGTTTTTTTITNEAGNVIGREVVTQPTQAGIINSTVSFTSKMGGETVVITKTTEVFTATSVAMSVTENLAGAYSGIKNIGGAIDGYDDQSIPEDNAGTQEKVNEYIYNQSYDVYGDIYYDFDGTFDMDAYYS